MPMFTTDLPHRSSAMQHLDRNAGLALPTSKLVFGGGSIGNLKTVIPESITDSLLIEATRNGITQFDTAPLYGFGLSELRLGHHLRSLERDHYKVSTKVGRYFKAAWGSSIDRGNWFAPLDRVAVIDYSRDGIMRSLEQSLNRLGIDRIDTVLVHDIDRRNQGEHFDARFRQVVDVAIPLLHDLKAAGHINAIGIGINEADVAADFLREATFDVLMLAGRVSLLNHAESLDLLALAQQRGTKVFAASVFNSGFLADIEGSGTFDYGRPDELIRSRSRKIRDVLGRFAVPLQAAAIQFPLRLPAIEAVVIGMSRPNQVAANLEWSTWPIPEETWVALKHEQLIATMGT